MLLRGGEAALRKLDKTLIYEEGTKEKRGEFTASLQTCAAFCFTKTVHP